MKKRKFILLIFIGWALAAGCAHQRKQSLIYRVNAYHNCYKNKEFSRASAFVESPQEFLKSTETISSDLVILDFEIVNYTFSTDGREADVEVVRSYYLLPSVTVRENKFIQKWKFDSKRKDWFLVSPY